jgi:hypothetical protein
VSSLIVRLKEAVFEAMADLVLIPEPPDGLREAALRGNLVLFVGAGVSRLAGCPGWDEFANQALHQLIKKRHLSHAQFAQIKHLSPRIKLAIATNIASEEVAALDYDALLPTPKNAHDQGKRLYTSLFKLGRVFVTTNYDRWLDTQIIESVPAATPADTPTAPATTNMTVIYRDVEFLPAALAQPNTVIHLHGSVNEPSEMVLTTRQYVERYANDHRTGDPIQENRTLTLLEHLFANYTVLFIGYGLEELEILEYVILKAKRQQYADHIEARHYLLQGFFSHEETVKRSMEAYYLRDCGIQLIPFLRDEQDHGQLLEVVERFAQLIPAQPPLVLGQTRTLEQLASEMEPLK